MLGPWAAGLGLAWGLALPLAAGLSLSGQAYDGAGNTLAAAAQGQTVNWVLSLSQDDGSLRCADGLLGAPLGSYRYVNYSPAAGTTIFGAWSFGITGTDWQVIDDGSGNGTHALQSQDGYGALFFSCPAAEADGEDACGSMEVQADVRIDSDIYAHQAGLVLRGDANALPDSYVVVVSTGLNPSGNLMLVRTALDVASWPAGAAYTAPIAPVSGTWYTLKAQERPVGTFRAKYWTRGAPEPAAWQFIWTDPSPLPCGIAGDGTVWAPGAFDPAGPASTQNFKVLSTATLSGTLWDTVTAGMDFVGASPSALAPLPTGIGVNEGVVAWAFALAPNSTESFTWTGLADCAEAGQVEQGALAAAGVDQAAFTWPLLPLICASATPTPTAPATPTPSPQPSATPSFTPRPSACSPVITDPGFETGWGNSLYGDNGPYYGGWTAFGTGIYQALTGPARSGAQGLLLSPVGTLLISPSNSALVVQDVCVSTACASQLCFWGRADPGGIAVMAVGQVDASGTLLTNPPILPGGLVILYPGGISPAVISMVASGWTQACVIVGDASNPYLPGVAALRLYLYGTPKKAAYFDDISLSAACVSPTPTLSATATRTPGAGTLPTLAPVNVPPYGGTLIYPSPATGPTVTLALNLQQAGQVKVLVLDARSRAVLSVDEALGAGAGLLSLDISALRRGVYFCKVKVSYADGSQQFLPTRRFSVLR